MSTHLAMLRDADVVTGARVGRNVVYRLTGRGDRLIALLEAEPT